MRLQYYFNLIITACRRSSAVINSSLFDELYSYRIRLMLTKKKDINGKY